jgi:4a-hydroxytetrahydrobiopterin dehydratase
MAIPLDEAAKAELADTHPDWEVRGEEMTRTLTFDDFAEAVGFVVRVGIAAEAAEHHPDIDIRWNRVILTLSTHSAKALTDRDTGLASTIDAMVAEG